MKKASLLVALALTVMSCSSLPPAYTVMMEDTYRDGLVDVSLVGLAPADSPSPQGLMVQCANNATSPVTVLWQKSKVSVDAVSQPVFAAGRPADDVISAGGRVGATVYPSRNVRETSGAYGIKSIAASPLDARQVSLSVCIEVENQTRFYTIRVSFAPTATSSAGQHMSR